MKAPDRQAAALEILYRSVIEHNLGDISYLPEDLSDCVFKVYREFVTCYLNVLRQNEKRPADWIPATVSIDAGITDQMRHFFSDYQHITKRFFKINQDMERLRAMDKNGHLKLYQFTIDKILKRCEPQDTREDTDEKSA